MKRWSAGSSLRSERQIGGRLLAASAAVVAALACGEVPTLEGGISYISPIVLPAPAVAAGDVLRDSLGNPARLTVKAYDRNNELIPGITATYVVSTVPAGVTIAANGTVTALDSIRSVQIVARIGDRLQTAAVTLEVVAQPDSVTRRGTIDSLVAATASGALQVTVTGLRGASRVGSRGIIVRYRITNVYPSRPIDQALFFFADGLRNDLTRAVDTTDASGVASRAITAVETRGIDSIEVQATVNSLRGVPLKGSPVRIVVPVKKGA